MKKTLVALAALAAVGAASAQSNVTITGNYGFAYQSTNTGAAGAENVTGFRTSDGKVVFKASEDLGSGLKAGASLDLQIRGRRSDSIAGRDSSLWMSGGFGKITMGSIDFGGSKLFMAHPAGFIGLDTGSTVSDGDGTGDIVQYTSPSMSGFTVSVLLADSIGTPGAGGLNNSATTRSATRLDLDYANGPLEIGFAYTGFGRNAAAATLSENNWRLAGTYDLGAAKIGLGFGREQFTGSSMTETALGVGIPFGSATVGLNWVRGSSSVAGVSDVSGWELAVGYDLSKRTKVSVGYISEDINAANNATTFRARLLHSF